MEGITQANQMSTQQTCIENQSTEQIDMKFEKLQTEWISQASKLDQLQNTIQRMSDNCFDNVSNLNAPEEASSENTQSNILRKMKILQNPICKCINSKGES
jgi:hypothetical protein